LGCIRALAEEKRNVPDDISIVSFDDSPYAAYLATPMTSVAQSYSEIGDVAVKLLFDQIQSTREPKGGILLPTSLIVRKSVKQVQATFN
jgi:LacI family transcriptional regulator